MYTAEEKKILQQRMTDSKERLIMDNISMASLVQDFYNCAEVALAATAAMMVAYLCKGSDNLFVIIINWGMIAAAVIGAAIVTYRLRELTKKD